MRILFLSQLLPFPPNAGPKVRSYHVLQYLVQAGHDVTLVAFCRPEDSSEAVAHLGALCEAVHLVPMHRSRVRDVVHLATSSLTRKPFLINRDSVPAMHRLLRQLMGNVSFDAIHCDQLWMAQYGLFAAAHTVKRPKLVMDQHNAVFMIPQRMASNSRNPLIGRLLRAEEKRLAQYEVEICSLFDNVVWVTEEDRAAVESIRQQLATRKSVGRSFLEDSVIPICVDVREKPVIARLAGARRVTFLGGMHWPPNAQGINWLAHDVWPRVLQEAPEALLTVIGKSPPRELELVPNAEIAGFVSDPAPLLAETAAFVVPLHAGGGMRVKIVDAWSWGMPIVSTTIGAEGVAFRHEHNMIVADDASSFAEAIVRLLRDEQLAQDLAHAGRRTAEQEYDWRCRYREWDALYG